MKVKMDKLKITIPIFTIKGDFIVKVKRLVTDHEDPDRKQEFKIVYIKQVDINLLVEEKVKQQEEVENENENN